MKAPFAQPLFPAEFEGPWSADPEVVGLRDQLCAIEASAQAAFDLSVSIHVLAQPVRARLDAAEREAQRAFLNTKAPAMHLRLRRTRGIREIRYADVQGWACSGGLWVRWMIDGAVNLLPLVQGGIWRWIDASGDRWTVQAVARRGGP